jgi:dipeptidyl aminopeptidase/acylaminoacyl peptidase
MHYRLVLLNLALLTASASGAAEPPPVEQFTNNARLDSLSISPSGNVIAATHRSGDRHMLTISEFPSTKMRQTLNYGDRLDVTDLHWIDDQQLVIQPARLLPQSGAGKFLTGEIYRVDVAAGKSTMLYSIFSRTTGSTSRTERRSEAEVPAQIMSVRSGVPNEVLIQTASSAISRLPGAVYRLNVRTGKLVGIGASPVLGARFVTGSGHRVALANGADEEGRSVLYYLPNNRDRAENNWELKVATRREEGQLVPVAWTGNAEEYYALDTRDASTRGIVIWDALKNSQRLLHRNAEADFTQWSIDPEGKPWMFAGYDHYPVYWYPDTKHPLAAMHQKLVHSLPNQVVMVTSQTDDMAKAVVRVSSAERPPVYLIVDVASAQPLLRMDSFPDLKSPDLAAVEAIEFKARDGLKVRGYLATPRGVDGRPRRKLPMIVSVHGGPHGVFDNYDYEFERQLFASRGYAVLQINFRGSGGRGRDYLLAGYGKWGREMQDDVTDGVRWAIQDGVADAARICIYGGSYGAFSALVGVAREPTMFQCAVGYAGVYDLSLLFQRGDIRMHARGVSYLKDAVGENEREIDARSPVNMAANIKAKVLLVHGVDDFRAPVEHANRMRKALAAAGNPPEWKVEAGEAHGFNDAANRAAAYRTMLEFFDKYLGK